MTRALLILDLGEELRCVNEFCIQVVDKMFKCLYINGQEGCSPAYEVRGDYGNKDSY